MCGAACIISFLFLYIEQFVSTFLEIPLIVIPIYIILLVAVKLKRLNDKDSPLVATLTWDPERFKFYRLVMQENETGEIVVRNKVS